MLNTSLIKCKVIFGNSNIASISDEEAALSVRVDPFGI